MLIGTNYQSKKESKYICDSCEKDITPRERIIINRVVNNKSKKKYDLCKDCYRKIRIIVEKHKLKKGSIKNEHKSRRKL